MTDSVKDGYVAEVSWSYTPEDYFEEPLCIEEEGFHMKADSGIVHLRISVSDAANRRELRDRLHADLDARFVATMMLSHRPYALADPDLVLVGADGTRHTTIFAKTGRLVLGGGRADVRYTGADGIEVDSKRDRLARNARVGNLLSKHKHADRLLSRLTASYSSAVLDPDNELIHLYEVREALSVRFGGQQQACSVLAADQTQWKRLGRLCNHEPLRQGRHRGAATDDALRDATAAELDEARGIAIRLIESYLAHIDFTASAASA